jgi:hypothetical protein
MKHSFTIRGCELRSIVFLHAFRNIFDVWSGSWILCPASGYQRPMFVREFLRAWGMGTVVKRNQNLAILGQVVIR